MPWQDRLVEPSYTAPSGTRISFSYEDVAMNFDKHTSVYDFPDASGSFVQDLGRSGRRFPLRVIFFGDNYDLEANVFEAMVEEQGIGKLQHPIYGLHDVVPFGRVSRTDNLKTAGNQAIFEVTFFETNTLLFPASTTSPASDLNAAITAYLEAAPVEYETTLSTVTTVEEVASLDRFRSVVDQVESGLKDVTAFVAEQQRVFEAVFDSINGAIDTFISDPLTLGFQVGQLVQIPARSTAAIVDRLKAYGNLVENLTTNGTIYTPGSDSQPNNSFHTDDLFVSNLVMGAASAVLNNEFITKTDAVAAAETILGFCDAFTAWREANFESLSSIDTGEAYQRVLDGCSIAAGFLVAISFTLKQERSIITVRPRTPIDLVAELYGTVDTDLDFFITSNNLVGGDIIEIPAGREVVYYV